MGYWSWINNIPLLILFVNNISNNNIRNGIFRWLPCIVKPIIGSRESVYYPWHGRAMKLLNFNQ